MSPFRTLVTAHEFYFTQHLQEHVHRIGTLLPIRVIQKFLIHNILFSYKLMIKHIIYFNVGELK